MSFMLSRSRHDKITGQHSTIGKREGLSLSTSLSVPRDGLFSNEIELISRICNEANGLFGGEIAFN
jgi:hypothetical protein